MQQAFWGLYMLPAISWQQNLANVFPLISYFLHQKLAAKNFPVLKLTLQTPERNLCYWIPSIFKQKAKHVGDYGKCWCMAYVADVLIGVKKKSTCTDGYRISIINISLFYKFLFYFFIFGGDGILQVV